MGDRPAALRDRLQLCRQFSLRHSQRARGLGDRPAAQGLLQPRHQYPGGCPVDQRRPRARLRHAHQRRGCMHDVQAHPRLALDTVERDGLAGGLRQLHDDRPCQVAQRQRALHEAGQQRELERQAVALVLESHQVAGLHQARYQPERGRLRQPGASDDFLQGQGRPRLAEAVEDAQCPFDGAHAGVRNLRRWPAFSRPSNSRRSRSGSARSHGARPTSRGTRPPRRHPPARRSGASDRRA